MVSSQEEKGKPTEQVSQGGGASQGSTTRYKPSGKGKGRAAGSPFAGDPEAARELGRRGGKLSGIARRLRAGVRAPAETEFLAALELLAVEVRRLWKKREKARRARARAKEGDEIEELSDYEEARLWANVKEIIQVTKAVIPMAIQHSGSIELPEIPVGLPEPLLVALRAQVAAAGGAAALLGSVPQLPAPRDEQDDASQ